MMWKPLCLCICFVATIPHALGWEPAPCWCSASASTSRSCVTFTQRSKTYSPSVCRTDVVLSIMLTSATFDPPTSIWTSVHWHHFHAILLQTCCLCTNAHAHKWETILVTALYNHTRYGEFEGDRPWARCELMRRTCLDSIPCRLRLPPLPLRLAAPRPLLASLSPFFSLFSLFSLLSDGPSFTSGFFFPTVSHEV